MLERGGFDARQCKIDLLTCSVGGPLGSRPLSGVPCTERALPNSGADR
jgi:hypothetical protein